jgi:undecaprenyl-diphosphatase|tara:strand:- start:956 stop:1543 length:588 start_codon:yes stop_codon:yes gene_type:complete
MFEEILKLDSKLFLFLNNLGTTKFDAFWLSLSKIEANILMYLFLILLFFHIKKLSPKFLYIFYLLFIIALMITITDQGANFFKDSFQRLRPCYNESISDSLRLVKENCGGKYGFFSAHASNSFSLAIFFGLLFKNRIRYMIIITTVYASLISYSRIYLGVHFPIDIIVGSSFGIFVGFIIYSFVYLKFLKFFDKA